MLNNKFFTRLAIVLAVFSLSKSNAQLNRILQKAKDKVATRIKSEGSAKVVKHSYDFVAGDTLIFSEDFAAYKPGASAASFKTNGTASVSTADGEKGKWMVLQERATYKLSKHINYPEHFTVEFDLLAMADKTGDISPMSFGFAADNSAGEYTSNAGAYVELHYYDGDAVNVGNNKLNKFMNASFDLAPGLNRPLHVSLAVQRQRVTVYLDKVKLADTDLFSGSDAKNFYITAPWQYANNAHVMVSNLKIAGFK